MATFSPFAGTTLSTTYPLPSPHPHSSITPRSSQITSDDDDDDEIVWNVSEGELEGDENYGVLTKPQSDLSTPVEDEPTKLLEMKMNSLNLSSKSATKTPKKAKNPKRSKKAAISFVQGTTTNDKKSIGNAYPSPKQADVAQV